MSEYLRDADPTLLSLFYADDAAFDRSARRSAAQLRLLMDRGADHGYFPKPEKYLFIADNPEEKEAAKRDFEQAGINLNYKDDRSYLGACLGTREELEEWVRTKVVTWAHVIRILDKIAKRYPQSEYSGLGISLHLEWQYMQSAFLGLGSMIVPIEDP